MKKLFLFLFVRILFNQLSSLPKLYYFLNSNRDVRVKDLREFEKTCLKVSKLRLDII